jgi:S-layer homology domain
VQQDLRIAARRATNHPGRSKTKLVITSGTVLSVIGGALVASTAPVGADPIHTVTNTLDDGSAGSLRTVLAEAHEGDTIVFDLPDNSTITLTGGQLEVDKSLNIQGPGAGDLTIDGNEASRVFYLYRDGPLAVTISGLTIEDGAPLEGDGGGILARSTDLTLDSVVIESNQATGDGGGVATDFGTLDINDSLLEDNHSLSNDGGGLASSGSDGTSVEIHDSTITGNTAVGTGGGASFFGVYDVSIERTVVSDNYVGNPVGGNGGGLQFQNAKYVAIIESTISDNHASGSGGGASFNSVELIGIDRSTISGNEASVNGGGVSVLPTKYFVMVNSTVSGNTAGESGGGLNVLTQYVSVVKYSTIVSNDASYGGGWASPSIGQEGGGGGAGLDVASEIDGSVDSNKYFVHTILGNNTADIEPTSDVAGSINVASSLVENTGGDEGPPFIGNLGGNTFGTDPALGPLANNGGPTQTHLPIFGSPVIDAGAPEGEFPETDQRGQNRVADGNGDGDAIIDIGSVEGFGAPTTTTVSVTASTATAVEGGAPGAFTFTRTGPTSTALTIGYSVGGSATSGDDYTPLSTVVIPAGQSSATIQVNALADQIADDGETVQVNVLSGADYNAGVPVSATVTIVEEAVVDPTLCENAPEDGFTDVPLTNVHEAAIDCLKFLGITEGGPQGLPDDQYGPALGVTRGQMASFLARLIERAGVALPDAAADHFDDDDGTTHEDNINRLFEAGIVEGFADGTYREGDPVRRDQMASFLLRTYDFISAQTLPPGDDAFTDDDGNVHEAAIDALEEAGVIEGTASPGVYNPSGDVRRDQMASFLIRLAELLFAQGEFPLEAPPAA